MPRERFPEGDDVMVLDLASLRNAIAQCAEALVYCRSEPARSDARLALHLRAGAIQAFEFTYELSIKTLKRFLESTETTPGAVDAMSFNQLIRRGWEVGLLRAELIEWKAFRRDRGTTSHSYDEAKAKAIFDAIPAFVVEAEFLLNAIGDRQGQAA